MQTKAIQNFLHQQIPLAKALGVEVVEAQALKATLKAPLDPNRNHMGTAFGGSLSALLILAGYTWLYSFLEEQNHSCHVILKSCDTNYLLPVTEDIVVTCSAPEADVSEKFLDAFMRKGVARIHLESFISNQFGMCATFKGEFVAKKSNTSEFG